MFTHTTLLVDRIKCKVAGWRLMQSIPDETWRGHEAWLKACKGLAGCAARGGGSEKDPIFDLSEELRQKTLHDYHDKYAKFSNLRILIHVPPSKQSMGGASLFSNWCDGLRHMGVKCDMVPFGISANEVIEKAGATVFFTSDHDTYLKWLDRERLQKYREKNPLILIFTASAEHDGNPNAKKRLDRARSYGVDFFVSFREPEYVEEFLSDWKSSGFDVISIPFSANPVSQFCFPFETKPLDYVFLASSNPEKAPRYFSFLREVFSKYRGVINGPGWNQDSLILERKYHPYLYGIGAVGINLHIPASIDLFSEINERTFILACTGTFQLCDSPRVLRRFFPETAVPSADSPAEYLEMFDHFLNRPEERVSYQLESLRSVYAGHTIFHRMATLLDYVILAQKRS